MRCAGNTERMGGLYYTLYKLPLLFSDGRVLRAGERSRGHPALENFTPEFVRTRQNHLLHCSSLEGDTLGGTQCTIPLNTTGGGKMTS